MTTHTSGASRANKPPSRRVSPALVAGFVLAALLGACSQGPSWQLKNISHLVHSLDFHLTSDRGKPVDAKDYRGDIVMLYFGYTNCPDTCPLTLAKLGRAVRALEPSVAKQVKILFVFDRRGKARLLATFKTKAPAITHDLKALAALND
jgi:cytochrome oxidase Cu insertion factor (SCO1/SenC/PrrC family)